MKTDFYGIDLFKFIMSFAVIAIHAPEYLWPNNRVYPMLIDWLIRLAVPFYFIVSGFLVQRNLAGLSEKDKTMRLRSRALKLLRLWGVWLLIYLPLAIYARAHSNQTVYENIIEYLCDVIFTGQSTYAQPLWFIYSMSVISFIWSYSFKKISLMCIFFTVLAYMKWDMMDMVFPGYEYVNNLVTWTLGGGIYMFSGALLNRYLRTVKIGLYIILCAACVLCSLSLYYFNLPYWTLFGGVAVFVLAYHINPDNGFNYKSLRKISMWIYYLHMYVIIATMIIVRQLRLEINAMSLFVIVCVITLGISTGINEISKRPRFCCLGALIQ